MEGNGNQINTIDYVRKFRGKLVKVLPQINGLRFIRYTLNSIKAEVS